MIPDFVKENNTQSIADLGGGNFRVAVKFITPGVKYTGCDVVEPLIWHLNDTHSAENIEFRLLNIIEEQFPTASFALSVRFCNTSQILR